MSTKSTNSAVTATSQLPAPVRKPFSIDICEPSAKAFQLASALVRQGYVVLKDRPVDVFSNGVASFTVVLGEPDETGYADAEAAMQHGLAIEAAEFERRVEQEVQARVELIKRQEHDAKVAAAVASHEAQIAKLKAEADAEIARLEHAKAAEVAAIKK